MSFDDSLCCCFWKRLQKAGMQRRGGGVGGGESKLGGEGVRGKEEHLSQRRKVTGVISSM